MTLTDDQKKAENFLIMLSEQLFERIIRNEYDLEKDARTLRRYQQQAQKIPSLRAEFETLNSLATLYCFAGHLEESIQLTYECYGLCEQMNDPELMAYMLNNVGATEIQRHNISVAKDAALKGIALIDAKTYPAAYRFLNTGLLNCAILEQDYATIDSIYEDMSHVRQEFGSSNREAYARLMVEVYRVMAERELARDDIEKAHDFIRLAEEFATGLELVFEMGDIYFTHAHIALKEFPESNTGETYWKKAEAHLTPYATSPYTGFRYMTEASYLQQHGYAEKADYFARKASDIFETHDLPENTQIARQYMIVDAKPSPAD